MIEWRQEEPDWYIAKCADLMLDVELMETGGDPEPWLWSANLNCAEAPGAIEFQSGWASSGDAAKLEAEKFAREWVARQAAAIGDGWVSVEERLPEDDRNVLVFISAPHAPYCYGIGSYGPMNGPRWRSRDIMFRSHFVSHWRPLPPRPEVK